jgi:hypothetical protein
VDKRQNSELFRDIFLEKATATVLRLAVLLCADWAGRGLTNASLLKLTSGLP